MGWIGGGSGGGGGGGVVSVSAIFPIEITGTATNPIVGVELLVPITLLQLQGKLMAKTAVKGEKYWITDSTAADLGVMVEVQEDFTTGNLYVSNRSVGGFLNADFQGVGDYSGVSGFVLQQGQWSVAKESGMGAYVNGDVVIYNQLQWKVTNAGAFNGSNPSANGAAYTMLSKSVVDGFIEEFDVCEYEFMDDQLNIIDWISKRSDVRGNVVEYSYIENQSTGFNPFMLMQWGNDAVHDNESIGSVFNALNNAGDIYNTTFANGNFSTVERNTGKTLSNCFFSGFTSSFTVRPDENFDSCTLQPFNSTFETTLPIDGGGNIDINKLGVDREFAGKLKWTSANPAETYAQLQNMQQNHPVMFFAGSGLTATGTNVLRSAAVMWDCVYENNIAPHLKGDDNIPDFIIFLNQGATKINRQWNASQL